ncbi:MAG: hypothetical protein KAS32_15290 [Candidatus Peribacteraceae bacterium]|nr:hypothetical protein [Candidatus Peribacteraceae bacterium]
MEIFLLTLSPFVVAVLSSILKPSKTSKIGGYRKTVLRFGVVLLSFVAVIGSAFLTESEVDITSIQTFSDALLTFLGSTGVYFLAKKTE